MPTEMSDNVLQTLQQLVQDVLAPDVRELKVRQAAFEKRVDERFEAMQRQIDDRFAAMQRQIDDRFEAMQRQMDERFEAVDRRFEAVDRQFDALSKQMELQLSTILAAISESRAQTSLSWMRELSDIRERIAVIESKLAS